jgi:hypothetical protein
MNKDDKFIIENVIKMLKIRDTKPPISCYYSEFIYDDIINDYTYNEESVNKINIYKNKTIFKQLYLDIDLFKLLSIFESLNKDSICLVQDNITYIKKKSKTKFEDITKELKKRFIKSGVNEVFELFEMKDFKNDIFNNIYFPIIFKIDINNINTITEDQLPIIKKDAEIYLKYYNFQKDDIICIFIQTENFNPIIKIIK